MSTTALLSPSSYASRAATDVGKQHLSSPPSATSFNSNFRGTTATSQAAQMNNVPGYGTNVSRLKSVFFSSENGGEPPPPSSAATLPPVPVTNSPVRNASTVAANNNNPLTQLSNNNYNYNRSRSLSTPRSTSGSSSNPTDVQIAAARLAVNRLNEQPVSSLSANSGSIVLNRINLLNNYTNGQLHHHHNPPPATVTNISSSTSSLKNAGLNSPKTGPVAASPPSSSSCSSSTSAGQAPTDPSVSSDHLTRFQSAKALFARMEEESAKQRHFITKPTSTTMTPLNNNSNSNLFHSTVNDTATTKNIFLIKSKFEATQQQQQLTPNRRSLSNGVHQAFLANNNNNNNNNAKNGRRTIGPINTIASTMKNGHLDDKKLIFGNGGDMTKTELIELNTHGLDGTSSPMLSSSSSSSTSSRTSSSSLSNSLLESPTKNQITTVTATVQLQQQQHPPPPPVTPPKPPVQNRSWSKLGGTMAANSNGLRKSLSPPPPVNQAPPLPKSPPPDLNHPIEHLVSKFDATVATASVKRQLFNAASTTVPSQRRINETYLVADKPTSRPTTGEECYEANYGIRTDDVEMVYNDDEDENNNNDDDDSNEHNDVEDEDDDEPSADGDNIYDNKENRQETKELKVNLSHSQNNDDEDDADDDEEEIMQEEVSHLFNFFLTNSHHYLVSQNKW